MSRAPAVRLALALAAVLLLALAAPPAVAAAPLGRPAPPGLLDPLWQWLHNLWAADGGAIDPFGVKALAPPRHLGTPRVSPGGAPYRAFVGADGGMIDPNGSKIVTLGHTTASTGKEGAGKGGPQQR
jgi:hypothetical protein